MSGHLTLHEDVALVPEAEAAFALKALHSARLGARQRAALVPQAAPHAGVLVKDAAPAQDACGDMRLGWVPGGETPQVPSVLFRTCQAQAQPQPPP